LESVPNGIAIYNDTARKFDSWLQAHYARVAEWNGLTTMWWNDGTWSTYMQYDSIHPTAAGQAQLARIVREQADLCYPSRVVSTTTTTTTVDDASTNAPWAGTEVAGASAYDTATVTSGGSFTPTGTVTYSFFTNGTCSGAPSSTQAVTLTSGAVPNSSTVGPLATAGYSFQAVYGGDGNHQASASACEPFTVTQAATTTTTGVDDAITGTPWAGTEATGASAYDTATVTSGASFTPTGTVTYSFFTNGTCSGSPSSTQAVTLTSGAVPNSSTVGPLATASYSFQAVYGGDGNHQASASACEPFTVN
jgi:large repetitive protein